MLIVFFWTSQPAVNEHQIVYLHPGWNNIKTFPFAALTFTSLNENERQPTDDRTVRLPPVAALLIAGSARQIVFEIQIGRHVSWILAIFF